MPASINEHSSHQKGSAESWITRCPQCSTAFRITRRHLMAAKGSVRCGSCLHIFKASSYIVGDDLPEELNFQPVPQQQQQEQPEEKRASLEFSDNAFAVEPSTTFGQVDAAEEPEEAPSEDEAWAKAMLEEMNLEEDKQPTSTDSEPKDETVEEDAQSFANALEEQDESDEYDQEEKPASRLNSLKDDPLDLSYRKQSLWKKNPVACSQRCCSTCSGRTNCMGELCSNQQRPQPSPSCYKPLYYFPVQTLRTARYYQNPGQPHRDSPGSQLPECTHH